MEATISQLSNNDLYDKLKHYGIAKGPVTNTTRGLYEKKLLQHIKENKIPGLDEAPRQIIPGAVPPSASATAAAATKTPPKPPQQPEPMQLNSHNSNNNDIIDITPNKKKTIRIQTDYDPLVNNNNFEDNNSSLAPSYTKSFTPQKLTQPVVTTTYSTTTYTTQTKVQPQPPQPQPQPQPPKPQIEFKLLKDSTVFQQPQPRQPTISPFKSSTITAASANDDLINSLRMRQATHTTYVSDQIDKARQEQQQEQQQTSFRSSSNNSSFSQQQEQQQQKSTSSSSNWRLYAIIIAIIVIVYLFYTYYLSASTLDDENLNDLLEE